MPPKVNLLEFLGKIKYVITIASGKGGVGKSTVSANLALALAARGAKVGLMDADVYGPSIPTILGITEKPAQNAEGKILPVQRYGVKVISMGFFVPKGEAVIWRGPMLHKMVQDFLGVVEWNELDYLLVDLPPGTGDIQLSLCQTIPITGAVIVSTPQEVAWNVAQKAIVMFDKLNAPIVGIIENMSAYVCTHCGREEEIFGRGGARRAAAALGIPFLGALPLLKPIRESADQGDPVVHSDPKGPGAAAFGVLADHLVRQVQTPRAQTKPIPAKIGPPSQSSIAIEWNDGKKSVWDPKNLRALCPCAACVDEFTGKRMLDPAKISFGIRALALNPIGRYALQIVWSDGHDTGLYAYDTLRSS